MWAAFTFVLLVAMHPAFEQPGRPMREAVLVAGVVMLGIRNLALRRGTRRLGAFAIVVAAALAWSIAGLLRVPRIELPMVAFDLAIFAAPWLIAVMVSGATKLDVDDEGPTRVDLGILLGAAAALVVLSLLAIGQAWGAWTFVPQARPPAATFVQRNVAAQCLAVALPLMIATLPFVERAASRWTVLAAGALGAAFLVATRTRAAWLGLGVAVIVGLVVLVIRLSPAGRRRLAALSALAAVAATLAAVVPQPEATRLPTVTRAVELLVTGEETTIGIRRALWANSLSIFADHPVTGVGAGRFSAAYPAYQDEAVPTPGFGLDKRAYHAHLDVLEVGAEFGTPAALAFLVLFVGAIVLSLRRAFTASKEELVWWHVGVAMAVLAGSIHGLFSFPLRSPASAFLLATAVAIAWRGTGATRWRLPIPIEAIAIALMLPALVALPYDLWRHADLGAALDHLARGECEQAVRRAKPVAEHPFRRRERGLATMVVFECERDARRTVDLLEASLARDPGSLNLLLATGARQLKAGRALDASRTFARASEIAPRLSRAWLGSAMAFDALGQGADARAACERALALPDAPDEAGLFCRGNGYAPPTTP